MKRNLRLTESQLAHRNAGGKLADAPASEHSEQAAFFKWWREYARLKRIPECLCFAIPNASALSDAGRIYKWREGLTAGVTDVFLAIPNYMLEKSGLFIEFKRGKAEPTDAQKLFMRSVEEQGYRARLSYSANEAIKEVECYLNSSVE